MTATMDPPPESLRPMSSCLSPAEVDYLHDLARTATTPEELQEIETLLNQFSPAPRTPKPSSPPPPRSKYERKRLRESQRQRKQSAAAREIANLIPPVSDPELRQRCLDSLRVFCETCFPNRFALAWSKDHLDVIADIERIVTGDGGLLAVAMPRGSGKTSLLEVAVLWAVFRGTHQFAVLLGATATAAGELLESIRGELEHNDSLADLFPEICVPIRALESVNQRRLLWNGQRVRVRITSTTILLPSLPPSPAAGSILRVAGILGRIRGMKHRAPDGRVIRPKLVLGDDLQTDESARRPKDVDRREKNVRKAVLGLAGPGQKLSALLALTVIQTDDLADRLLDKQRHPEWNGRRTQLMYAWPTNRELWNEYAEIRARGLRNGDEGRAATEFYRQNRAAMDAGSQPAWPERFNPDEISATQHAENIRFDDPIACAAEYQNQPISSHEIDETGLTPADICRRMNGRSRTVLPLEAEYLGLGIDVQQAALYWSLIACAADATPYVIDYGVWPEQRRTWFRLKDLTNTIQTKFPKLERRAQIYQAIRTLTDPLMAKEFRREDGTAFTVGRGLVDGRWEDKAVFQACTESPHKSRLQPAFGLYIRAGRPGINDRETKSGEINKHDFRIPPLARGRTVRHVQVDSNAWISRVTDACRVPMGAKGALTLFTSQNPEAHQLFAEHLTAEYPTTVTANLITRREWHLKPGNPDNHWLDATKLAWIACCIQGADPARLASDAPPKRTNAPKKTPRYAVI